jgi:two-component system sensor histidine kinase PilS (NtrC family)
MRLSYYVKQSSNQGLTVEFIRVGLFFIVLLVSLLTTMNQGSFVNWSVFAPFYTILTAALGLHILWISIWEKLVTKENLLFFGFIIDALFIASLIYYFGLNHSFFLFLHLVNILLAGIIFRGVGAYTLALFTSIFFTLAVLFSPEMKGFNFFFLLALNNLAFFGIAGLSGYLSEQLNSVGQELQKTGLNLRSAQDFNQVLIENIPSGMLSFTEQGELLTANTSAVEILEDHQLMTKNWFDFFPETTMQDRNHFKGDVSFKSGPEQEVKILGLTISKIYSSELQSHLCIALFDDLTKFRQLEYSARQNEKMAAVGGLAAGIAHEIRNPLAGISGSVELLSQTTANEDDRKLMRIILREIDRLNNLITEFLEYSSPETAPTEMINVGPILIEVLDAIRSDPKLRTDILQVRGIDENLFVIGKKDKLKQVFLNIILNSYQAMNANDPNTKASTITVKAGVKENELILSISDTGCGMSEATRRKMFEPFHTTKPKGTGLGLAVTHKILEGHRVKVLVKSEQGIGTEFVLTFPRPH